MVPIGQINKIVYIHKNMHQAKFSVFMFENASTIGIKLSVNKAFVGKLTNLSSPAGLAVLTLASHVSGQGSIPGGHR